MKGQIKRLQMLQWLRLERLLASVWAQAIAKPPDLRAVPEARHIIRDQRVVFGLDRDLGDIDRPLAVAEVGTYDYSKLTNDELETLLRILERATVVDGDGTKVT